VKLIRDAAGRELCPSCAPDSDEINHPTGMIFVGWGHGWQACQKCGGSGLAETIPPPHCEDDHFAEADVEAHAMSPGMSARQLARNES
jgi:hypothetical protein